MKIALGALVANGIQPKVKNESSQEVSRVLQEGEVVKSDVSLEMSKSAKAFYKPADNGFAINGSMGSLELINERIKQKDFSVFLPPSVVKAYES